MKTLKIWETSFRWRGRELLAVEDHGMKIKGLCDGCDKTGDLLLNTNKPFGWFSVSVASSAMSASVTYCPACYGTILWPVGLLAEPDPKVAPALPTEAP